MKPKNTEPQTERQRALRRGAVRSAVFHTAVQLVSAAVVLWVRAGLDPAGVEQIMGNILDYHRPKDATIIVISPSMEEMARRADRLVVVNDGRLPLEGTPREVFAHREELEAMGLGVPTMTDLFHRLRAMGADVDPSVYTVEQAKAAILNALARKGSTPASSDGRGAV